MAILNREYILNKIAYRFYEIRTKEDSPLLGYGNKESDYLRAIKILEFFEQINKEEYNDYMSLFGDIIKEYFDE